MNQKDKKLGLGCTVLTIGYVGLLAASVAIVSREADPSSAVGRHLWAGALANAALAIVEVLVIQISLRQKQRWAWWAVALPIVLYGLPILVLDLSLVSTERLFETLAPQVFGLVVAIIGLALVAPGVFLRKEDS